MHIMGHASHIDVTVHPILYLMAVHVNKCTIYVRIHTLIRIHLRHLYVCVCVWSLCIDKYLGMIMYMLHQILGIPKQAHNENTKDFVFI